MCSIKYSVDQTKKIVFHNGLIKIIASTNNIKINNIIWKIVLITFIFTLTIQENILLKIKLL